MTKAQIKQLQEAERLIAEAYDIVEVVVPSGTSEFADEFYRRIDSADARLVAMYTSPNLINPENE